MDSVNGGKLNGGALQGAAASLAMKVGGTFEPERKRPVNSSDPEPKKPNPEPKRPGSEPKEQEPPTLKALLLGKVANVTTIGEVRKAIKEGDEIAASPELVDFFVKLIQEADAMGVRRNSVTRSPQEAEEHWFSLSWEDREAQLRSWAAEDAGARTLIENIDLFNRNFLAKEIVRAVVTSFERPCRGIKTYSGLILFLNELVAKNFAIKFTNPQRQPDAAVIIRSGPYTYAFLPKAVIQVAKLGWHFVKEAEARARNTSEARVEGVESLKEEATKGLNPASVSAGQEGKLLLFIGGRSDRAVFLEVRERSDGKMEARVRVAVGIWIKPPLPSLWTQWTPETRYIPATGPQWPAEEIPRSLQAWTERIQREEQRIAEEKAASERLKALATLPLPPAEKGLTQLFKGGTGVMVFGHPSFEWGDSYALFSLAIERRQGEECFRLAGFHTASREHHRAFSALIGQPLPRFVVEEGGNGLRARFEKLPQLSKLDFEVLKMVERLCQMRLNYEH